MGFDATRLTQAIGDMNEAHADRDGLTGLDRAVFLARGGHAPGEACPTWKPEPQHHYWCEWPDDECHCGIAVTPPQHAGNGPESVVEHRTVPVAEWDKKEPKTPWGCPLGMVLAAAVFVAGIVLGSWLF